MEDNHERKVSPAAGEAEEGFATAAVAESAADSVDQIDPVTPSDGPVLDSFQSLPKDVMPGVMEDTFVDCPDEIETFDSQQNSEENDNLQDDKADEPDSGIKVPEMIAEIELLRDKLDLFMPLFFSFLGCNNCGIWCLIA
ncbi:uncharacterized protein LOC121798497 [Salvia splendens]|uniref:uncharacterized protein LOC121798497 n=1 Tax=Salvia splendens TaxID=180675 RepID=UPI001C2531FF|nr:uncharacterized protein LOC121798497 [Salvia splendens]